MKTEGSYRQLRGMCLILLGLAIGYVIFRVFIGGYAFIESGSMEPTVMTGQWVYVDNATFGAVMPRRLSDIPLLNYVCMFPAIYRLDSLSDWGHHKLPALHMPRRGDVIVFKSPEGTGRLVMKRIIGLPGDTIEIRNGFVIINGSLVRPEYAILRHSNGSAVKKTSFPAGKSWDIENYGPYVVPPEPPVRYFVMGDNRPHSTDSRFWGLVEYDSICGRLIKY